MLLADLVACTDEVSATSSRTGKIEALGGLLAGTAGSEAGVVAGLIAGDPRQGRIGVGWATVAALRTQAATQPSLTVADLDAMLDAVANASGDGSTQRRLDLLGDFLARATAAETDFVRRLLVGELRQGASEGVVVEAIARAAGVPAAPVRRALMLAGDLGETADIALSKGRPGLDAVGFRPMRPIRPMLASTAEDAASAVAELGLCSVEWKFDGIRIQAHRQGDEVRVWTRNLNEVTGRLGEVVDVMRDLPVDTVALDGEVLGLAEDLSPAAFQDTMGRVGTRQAGEAAPAGTGPVRVAPVFFDVPHLNDRCRRRTALEPPPRRCGPALRPGRALPQRQAGRRGRHHRGGPFIPTGRRRVYRLGAMTGTTSSSRDISGSGDTPTPTPVQTPAPATTTVTEPEARPVTDDGDHDRFAHYTRRADANQAYVEGTPVRALCGKVWVPSRDPSRYPVCPECTKIRERLRRRAYN